MDFPIPYNTTGIRAFVNLCGFYRRHIPAFSDIASPMNELLKKKVNFEWSINCEDEFTSLKEALLNAVTLVIPGPDTKYHYTMDDDGVEKPVLFLSRKLQPAEVKYATVEKELLAVIYAMRKLRKYLLDNEFILFCDNTAVCYLFNEDESSQRLQRKNAVADALFRFPTNNHRLGDNGEADIEAMYDHMLVEESFGGYEDWLQDLVLYFRNPGHGHFGVHASWSRLYHDYWWPPIVCSRSTKPYNYISSNEIFIRKVRSRLCWTLAGYLERKCLRTGRSRNVYKMSRLYYDYWWPRSYIELREHVNSCTPCQLYAPAQPNTTTISVPTRYLFEKFALDFVGPLPVTKSGNVYVLVAVEMFTRWPIVLATKTTEAKVVSSFLYCQIFCMYGLPTHVLTDNGSSFDNQIVDGLLSLISVHHQYTAPYRPSTNGRNEQMNGNIIRALKKLCMQQPSTWDENLESILYAYRTKVHSVLKISPFEYLYGISPPTLRQDPIPNARSYFRFRKISDAAR
ncbi:hypothetical protein [Parasitella parasitica]|uniref:Integrase catalytic domain-containing protein n=1 Tax=Parasitella parasitica TaxID=35722 RepID=A0A0B7NRC7_9FUNG|nr:hypothetical protein [Parasitella parasitica]